MWGSVVRGAFPYLLSAHGTVCTREGGEEGGGAATEAH